MLTTSPVSTIVPSAQPKLPKSGADQTRYLSLSKPLLVNCQETSEDTWRMKTVTQSMSLYGACFAMRRPVCPGRVIHLVFPDLHYRLRHYDHGDAFYKIWGLVRSCRIEIGSEWNSAPKFVHDVTFFGRMPPSHYYKDSTALYDLDPSGTQAMLRAEEHSHQRPLQLCSTINKDRRKNDRYGIPYEITLSTFTNEGLSTTLCEQTITENVSSCGALMRTTMNLNRGAMVWVTCQETKSRVAGLVRHTRRASNQGGFNFLHLQWIGGTWSIPGLH